MTLVERGGAQRSVDASDLFVDYLTTSVSETEVLTEVVNWPMLNDVPQLPAPISRQKAIQATVLPWSASPQPSARTSSASAATAPKEWPSRSTR